VLLKFVFTHDLRVPICFTIKSIEPTNVQLTRLLIGMFALYFLVEIENVPPEIEWFKGSRYLPCVSQVLYLLRFPLLIVKRYYW